MRRNKKKSCRGIKTAAAVVLLLFLCAWGCGRKAESDASGTEILIETSAGDSRAETTLPETAAVSGEGSAEAPEEAAADRDTGETYPGTLAAAEGEDTAVFGVMYAAVIDIQREADGSVIYNLQDVNDPENAWAIPDTDIGDIVETLEKGSMAAFLFSGDMIRDAENVEFIAAVPYSAYRLGRTQGTTENNVMSTFSLRTDDGQLLYFMKDNCRIEEGAMSKNAGDRIVVYYAYSESEQVYYPLEIYAAD